MNKELLFSPMPFCRQVKLYLSWVSVLLLGYHTASAQNCTSVSTDITTNPKVCSLYGDANGNSTWDWTVDGTNPDYCTYWYARTSSLTNLLTPMGSPFVNGTTGKIATIADKQDYTREKGWELLRRDFGCSHVTSYPYFILYNRYSGLMRIFIYQNESQTFSGMSVKIEPFQAPYPATTSAGDPIQAAPDKYLTSTSASTFGKAVIAVSESPGGSNRWTLVEFDPSFDPNIANAVYTGAGLQFTIYGVQNYALQAAINGTTVSGSTPGLNFTPSSPPTTSNGNTVFTAAADKFTTFAKDFNDIKTEINGVATGISAFLALADAKSLEGDVKKKADDAKDKTSSLAIFSSVFGNIAGVFTGGANVFKLAGTLAGLFAGGGSKTPAPAPVYTSVNLTLTGSLTLKDITQTFVLRVPGTVQPNGNNATYYQCPLGIFNLVNTPQADTVVYDRCVQNGGDVILKKFVAYKIKNDIPVSYFDGTGLDLVSVQAAIMAKVQPGSNSLASYNPLAADLINIYNPGTNTRNILTNFLRPEFDANRLEVTLFDTSAAHLHLFQTPYVNLECIKGQSINVPATTTVSLRVKAILKRKDDPTNTPILYVQDYRIDPVQGAALDPTYRQSLITPTPPGIVVPPYANYTVKAVWKSDTVIQNRTYTAAITESADHTITAGTNVNVNASAQGVVFKSGSAVYLEPGFVAMPGCSFQAYIEEYGSIPPTCGTLQKQAFQTTNPCFNTTAQGMSQKPATNSGAAGQLNTADSSASSLTFYPNPARETLTITGLEGWGGANIAVYDQTGRKLFTVNKQDESAVLQLNVASLTDGVYFVEIQGSTRKLTHKFIVAR